MAGFTVTFTLTDGGDSPLCPRTPFTLLRVLP